MAEVDKIKGREPMQIKGCEGLLMDVAKSQEKK